MSLQCQYSDFEKSKQSKKVERRATDGGGTVRQISLQYNISKKIICVDYEFGFLVDRRGVPSTLHCPLELELLTIASHSPLTVK